MNLEEPPSQIFMAGITASEPTVEWRQGDHWQLTALFAEGRFSVNGRRFDTFPGAVVVTRPRSLCSAEDALGRNLRYVSFNFEPALGAKQSDMVIPELGDVSSDYGYWDQTFRETLHSLMRTHARKTTTLWSLLWRIARDPATVRRNVYVEKAEAYIESRLSEKIEIADLARHVELSHSQLIRAFREEFGEPPLMYIRHRRVELASRLLTSSTTPIKTIAARVGCPDLQRFNKLIRESMGGSPRQIRERRVDHRVFDDNRDEAW